MPLTPELEAAIRASICPPYARQPGTASHERAALLAEIDRLRQDCAQAYQVVGAGMLGEPVPYSEADVTRVLDNLNAAANGSPRPHENLLPWPVNATSAKST